jgi:hypothetical protein
VPDLLLDGLDFLRNVSIAALLVQHVANRPALLRHILAQPRVTAFFVVCVQPETAADPESNGNYLDLAELRELSWSATRGLYWESYRGGLYSFVSAGLNSFSFYWFLTSRGSMLTNKIIKIYYNSSPPHTMLSMVMRWMIDVFVCYLME